VRTKHAVVRFHNRRWNLGWRGYGEGPLGLSPVVDGEPLKEEGTKAGTGATAGGVEDEETLKAGAVIGQLADAVEDSVNKLLADGVVTTSVVVGGILGGGSCTRVRGLGGLEEGGKMATLRCIRTMMTWQYIRMIRLPYLLPTDDLLRVVKLTVSSATDLVTHVWFKVDVDGTRDVLSGSGLWEEGVEGIVTSSDCLVGRHLTVRLDAVLEAVEFPATVTGLDTGLADVDW
jgi:hypothetical protein